MFGGCERVMSQGPESTLKPSRSVAEQAKDSNSRFEKKVDEDEALALSGLTSTESTTLESREEEVPPTDTSKDSIDSEPPSFHVQCLTVGNCLLVFKAGDQEFNEMALGIGNALSKYKSTSHQSVDFVWPPASTLNLPSVSSHGGWESARRAFHSLINGQDWTANTLVTVGSDANEVTELLRNSEYAILKLDEFPSTAQSKKALWQRIQEIS